MRKMRTAWKSSGSTPPSLETEADAVVVGVFEDAPPEPAPRPRSTRRSAARFAALIERKEFTGQATKRLPLLVPVGQGAGRCWSSGWATQRSIRRRHGVSLLALRPPEHLAGKPRAAVAFFLDDGLAGRSTESGVCGAMVGCQRPGSVSGGKELAIRSSKLLWAGGSEAALASGRILGESVNLTRRLVNEPADDIYPESFAERAAEVAEQMRAGDRSLGRKAAGEAERCGSLLAVAKGSNRPPRLVILRHRGAATGAPTLAIVGKGVTFDSGGLSLKPPDGMLTMKCDMAGAATMLGAMQAIALLKLPINVDRPRRPGREHDRPGGHEAGRRAARPATAARSKCTTPTPKAGWCWPTCLSRGRRPGRRQDRRPGHAHRRLRGGAGHRSGRRDDQRSGLVRRGARGGPQRAASRSGNCRCFRRSTTS